MASTDTPKIDIKSMKKLTFNNNVYVYQHYGVKPSYMDVSKLVYLITEEKNIKDFWNGILTEVAPWLFYLSHIKTFIACGSDPSTSSRYNLYPLEKLTGSHSIKPFGIDVVVPKCYDSDERCKQVLQYGHWMMFITQNAEYIKMQGILCDGKIPENYAISAMPSDGKTWLIVTPSSRIPMAVRARERDLKTNQEICKFLADLTELKIPDTSVSALRFYLNFLCHTRFDGIASLTHYLVCMAAICSDRLFVTGRLLMFSGEQGSGKSSCLAMLKQLAVGSTCSTTFKQLKHEFTPYTNEFVVLIEEIQKMSAAEFNEAYIKMITQCGNESKINLKNVNPYSIFGGRILCMCGDQYVHLSSEALAERRIENVKCNGAHTLNTDKHTDAIRQVTYFIEKCDQESVQEFRNSFISTLRTLAWFLSFNLPSQELTRPSVLSNNSFYATKQGAPGDILLGSQVTSGGSGGGGGRSGNPYARRSHTSLSFLSSQHVSKLYDRCMVNCMLNCSILPSDPNDLYFFFRIFYSQIAPVYNLYTDNYADKQMTKLQGEFLKFQWDKARPLGDHFLPLGEIMKEWKDCISKGNEYPEHKRRIAINTFRQLNTIKASLNFREDFTEYPGSMTGNLAKLLSITLFHIAKTTGLRDEHSSDAYPLDCAAHHFNVDAAAILSQMSSMFCFLFSGCKSSSIHANVSVKILIPKAFLASTGRIAMADQEMKIYYGRIPGPISSLTEIKTKLSRINVDTDMIAQLKKTIQSRPASAIPINETEQTLYERMLALNDPNAVIVNHIKSNPSYPESQQVYYDILGFLVSSYGLVKKETYFNWVDEIKTSMARKRGETPFTRNSSLFSVLGGGEFVDVAEMDQSVGELPEMGCQIPDKELADMESDHMETDNASKFIFEKLISEIVTTEPAIVKDGPGDVIQTRLTKAEIRRRRREETEREAEELARRSKRIRIDQFMNDPRVDKQPEDYELRREDVKHLLADDNSDDSDKEDDEEETKTQSFHDEEDEQQSSSGLREAQGTSSS